MKPIQEERMRGYFVTAAKDLIRGEGLAVVSARNVAERAGYSYATLYNYFKDINDLIFSCVEDFMQECRDFVLQNTKIKEPGKEALLEISRNYTKYFVQYPSSFDLLFLQKKNAISSKESNMSKIHTFFNSFAIDNWNYIQKTYKGSEQSITSAMDCHSLALHGLLTLYLTRRKEMGYKEFMEQVNRITEYIVEGLVV